MTKRRAIKKTKKNEALLELISMHGSQAALAKKMKVDRQLITYWLKNGVTPKKVPEAVKASNHTITADRFMYSIMQP